VWWVEEFGGGGDRGEAGFGVAGGGADGSPVSFGHDDGGVGAGFAEVGGGAVAQGVQAQPGVVLIL